MLSSTIFVEYCTDYPYMIDTVCYVIVILHCYMSMSYRRKKLWEKLSHLRV